MKLLTLNQVTLCADGSIGLQLLKHIVDPDSGEVLLSEPHRIPIDFDADVDATVADHVAALGRQGYPALTVEEIDRIREIDRVARGDAQIKAMRQHKMALRVTQKAAAERSRA